MIKIKNKILLVSVNFILCTGCSDRPPEFVYVPRASVQETVIIRLSVDKIKVGQPIILYASRSTHGYVQVRYNTVSERACWWRSEPPEEEKEVADNLRWEVDSDGVAIFNTNYRSDHTREVVFTKPGNYKLKAYSAVYCPPETVSNEVGIEVYD